MKVKDFRVFLGFEDLTVFEVDNEGCANYLCSVPNVDCLKVVDDWEVVKIGFGEETWQDIALYVKEEQT